MTGCTRRTRAESAALFWPPGRVALLRTMIAQGQSYTTIARTINADGGPKMSRCAISGKVHRMGLAMAKTIAKQRTAQQGATRHHIRGAAPPPLPPAVKHRTRGGAAKGEHNLRFLDREPDQCVMFIGDQSGALGLVCGAQTVRGDWCAACAGLVYLPAARAARAA